MTSNADNQVSRDDVARRESKLLVERIQERISALGTNMKATSLKAELGETAISEIVSRKNKNPSGLVLKAIAKALDCNIAYLLGDSDIAEREPEQRGAVPIAILGVAEAGAFRHMAQQQHDYSGHEVKIATPSKRYPLARHFALAVRGDSMNDSRPPINDGMYVLCVDMASADIEVESNQLYAVRRSLDNGQTFETTIKRAMVFRDRIEYRPESTNARHDKIVTTRNRNQAGELQVDAIGLVYGAFIDFE